MQLHIWELYEAQRPHVRHYFRRMALIPGYLYGAAPGDSEYPSASSSFPRRVATAQEPDIDDVPDDALTPDSKVMLLSCKGPYYLYDLSTDQDLEPLSALAFRRIRGYPCDRSANVRYHWVNFKFDTLCFTQTHMCGHHNHLTYFEEDSSLSTLPANPASPIPDETLFEMHWFFRVQKLDLLVIVDGPKKLGSFDKQILARHPSVKTVTIVPTVHQLKCHHQNLVGLVDDLGDVVHEVERIPLPKMKTLLEVTPPTRPCDCSILEKRIASLQGLRQEVIDLLHGQQGRRVDVRVEVEMYWAGKKPDIDALIAEALLKDKEEEAAEPPDPQDVSSIDEAGP